MDHTGGLYDELCIEDASWKFFQKLMRTRARERAGRSSWAQSQLALEAAGRNDTGRGGWLITALAYSRHQIDFWLTDIFI